MAITIRTADLDVDRDALIELMLRYLTPRSNSIKFDWLYRNNPDGPATAWVAEDNDEKTIVGSGAVIPRRMYVRGEEQLGCLMADFWIHPQYRTLGPATQLQRACLEEFYSGRFALCYDFPQSSMGAVYKRVGIVPTEQLIRLTKLLRLDQKVGEAFPIPLMRTALSAVGNYWLELGERRYKSCGKCTISVHDGTYEEEFSLLAERVSAKYGVCVRRSAAYLNWRYRNHYFLRYETLTAHADDLLMAYLIFVDGGDYVQVVDLFGVDDPEIIRDLVSAVISECRGRGRSAVNTQLLGSHPWVTLLKHLGFYVRESSPLVVLAATKKPRLINCAHNHRWFLTYGDVDP